MYGQLAQYFTSRTVIDAATQAHINTFFKPLQTKRNEMLLREGEVCKEWVNNKAHLLAAAILQPIDYLLRRNVGHCNEKDRKSGCERARIKVYFIV